MVVVAWIDCNMFGRDRPMDNPINWSFKIGRLFEIDIRVHILFILCAVFLLVMEMPKGDDAPSIPMTQILLHAFGSYAILFGIVLLHEFGHCFGCRRVGGEASEILIWPLGGLASVAPPHNPRAHMVTTVAGPMVNVVICGVCSLAIVAWTGQLGAVPWNPLHPFTPVSPIVLSEGQWWLLQVYGLSYFILLINLLPVFPFDGGRILQAWLWPRKGYRASMELATGIGMGGAIAIGLWGIVSSESLLLMIAVFGYITCWQSKRMAKYQDDFGDGGFSSHGEFSESWNEPERKPGYFERRKIRKADEQAEREHAKLASVEKEVERILSKVSASGLASLSAAERRVLEEETKRQQSINS